MNANTLINRASRFPIVMLLVLGMLLQGCAAATVPVNYAPPVDMQMMSVQATTVAYGIASCLADKGGTQILVNGEQIVFAWGYEWGTIGMFGIDLKNKTLVDMMAIVMRGGGLTNAKTAGDLLKWMQANGWQTVSGAALGEAMKTTILASLEAIVSAPFLALYLVLPVGEDGSFDLEQLPGLVPHDIPG
jgi:hypothetical protein